MLLEVEGYRPITAGHFDGVAARLSYLERAPDVIICDYLVTGDTSQAALDRARQLEKCHLLNKYIMGTSFGIC